jgi:hypothetical protein
LTALVLIIIAGWFLVRPGIITIQPSGAVPEGVTLVYQSREAEIHSLRRQMACV